MTRVCPLFLLPFFQLLCQLRVYGNVLKGMVAQMQ